MTNLNQRILAIVAITALGLASIAATASTPKRKKEWKIIVQEGVDQKNSKTTKIARNTADREVKIDTPSFRSEATCKIRFHTIKRYQFADIQCKSSSARGVGAASTISCAQSGSGSLSFAVNFPDGTKIYLITIECDLMTYCSAK